MTASKNGFRRWSEYREYDPQEMLRRAAEFRADIQRRRTIRDFSDRAVPRQVIEDCVAAAASAPSGANMQPWRFVAVADAAIKHRIRVAAEDEERHFYEHRASEEWLEALAPLGTDADKPFLETAPWLIAVFEERWGLTDGGERRKHYYPTESVGIATGFLIAALHNAGLATLTHTPSPMKFLNEILGRSRNERPFLLLVTGYPSETVRVPDISRKPLGEVADFKIDHG
ncbi:MAG: nitroreductase family protein [Chromatiales bacterium]|jgi:nitroreductase|nr:nitroreductase family protein [Chromatiales bacterium]